MVSSESWKRLHSNSFAHDCIQAEEFLVNLFSILRFEADRNVAKLAWLMNCTFRLTKLLTILLAIASNNLPWLQLTIRAEEFLVNLFSILRFEADRNVAKLRKPVDKDKWATEPAVVNAFYNPNKNDIGMD